MLRYLLLTTLFWSTTCFAIPCDCEVWVYAPMTGSHKWSPTVLKRYQLEEYGNYSFQHQRQCRESCQAEVRRDMPTTRLRSLLLSYSERLIRQGELGHNCTGLTTLKYPVRVKAVLGQMGLGNVEDRIEVVNHEELCFY
jgi:hypothetical protein